MRNDSPWRAHKSAQPKHQVTIRQSSGKERERRANPLLWVALLVLGYAIIVATHLSKIAERAFAKKNSR
jgi:hypothetical protein